MIDIAALAGEIEEAAELALDQAAEAAAGVARRAAGGGPVARSIHVRRTGRFARELVADDPGAAFVENGRGPAVAHGHVMHFRVNGRDVFARRVGPARAHPFMAPAGEELEAHAAEVLARLIGQRT